MFLKPLHAKHYCWEMSKDDKYQCGMLGKTQIITLDEYQSAIYTLGQLN